MRGRQINQTQTAESDTRWRSKVIKYERYHVTVHRLKGYQIIPVAHCEVKMKKDQRLTIKVNDSSLTWEQLHLEIKGGDYDPQDKISKKH